MASRSGLSPRAPTARRRPRAQLASADDIADREPGRSRHRGRGRALLEQMPRILDQSVRDIGRRADPAPHRLFVYRGTSLAAPGTKANG
jgi:hypothetical protein